MNARPFPPLNDVAASAPSSRCFTTALRKRLKAKKIPVGCNSFSSIRETRELAVGDARLAMSKICCRRYRHGGRRA